MNTQADIRVQIGGGLDAYNYGGQPKPAFRSEMALDGIEITFTQSFCPFHIDEQLHNGTECIKCDEHVRTVLFNARKNGFPRVNCEHIDHTHECACWGGHNCAEGCYVFDAHAAKIKQTAEGEEERERLKKALYGMAKEAPNDKLLSIFERLAALEEENKDLRLLVSKLIEDGREAVGSTKDL